MTNEDVNAEWLQAIRWDHKKFFFIEPVGLPDPVPGEEGNPEDYQLSAYWMMGYVLKILAAEIAKAVPAKQHLYDFILRMPVLDNQHEIAIMLPDGVQMRLSKQDMFGLSPSYKNRRAIDLFDLANAYFENNPSLVF